MILEEVKFRVGAMDVILQTVSYWKKDRTVRKTILHGWRGDRRVLLLVLGRWANAAEAREGHMGELGKLRLLGQSYINELLGAITGPF